MSAARVSFRPREWNATRVTARDTVLVVLAPLQHALQLSTLPFTRRSELISKISADAGLMGNDHILSLRTGNALVQRRAPALGQHIYAPR